MSAEFSISRLLEALFFSSIFFLTSQKSNASVFQWEKKGEIFRVMINLPKESISFEKDQAKINIRFSKRADFQAAVGQLNSLGKILPAYLGRPSSSGEFDTEGAYIGVSFARPQVQCFPYYDHNLKAHVIDFWNDEKKQSVMPPVAKPPAKKSGARSRKKQANRQGSVAQKLAGKAVKDQQVQGIAGSLQYRDFRYGASFIWNHAPLLPKLEASIDLGRKTFEYFYPLPEFEGEGAPLAHMRASLKLYRNEQFGKMNKSIQLFHSKFGHQRFSDENMLLRANALLKETIARPNKSMRKSALSILRNLENQTKNDVLRQQILRFLTQSSVERRDWPSALKLAKKLYIVSNQLKEKPVILESAKVILHALASLNQIDEIKQFSSDEYLQKLIPSHYFDAYTSKVLMEKEDYEEVIRRFSSLEIETLNPAVLFNLGESSFQVARYDEAIRYFDHFLKNYSFHPNASKARLRIGLSYELDAKGPEKTSELYKMTLNRSPYNRERIEARLRYVGVEVLRKKNLEDEDLEKLLFLENNKEDVADYTKDLRQLLWLVRIRSFIIQKQYEKALKYSQTLEMLAFTPSVRQTFLADMSEVHFGLEQQAFELQDFGRVIKDWELSGQELSENFGYDAEQLYLIGYSYIRTGLQDKASEIIRTLKEMNEFNRRSFPRWIPRKKAQNPNLLAKELAVVRSLQQKNWKELAQDLKPLKGWSKLPFYQGVAAYHQKKFKQTITHFEELVLKEESSTRLTSEQSAELVLFYVDSLYQTGQDQKVQKVLPVLARDLKGVKGRALKNAEKRIRYLYLEQLFSVENKSSDAVAQAKRYIKDFPTSAYQYRLLYLVGKELAKGSDIKKARRIFEELIKNEKTPIYIKELAKTEVTAIRLNEKLVSY